MNEPTNPWAWAQWARQQDPGTYGATPVSFADDPYQVKSSRALLERNGLWNPAWNDWASYQASAGDSDSGAAPATPDFSSLAGYKAGAARGPGHTRFAELIDPTGKSIDQQAYQRESTGLKDYLQAAAIVGGGAYGMNALFGGLGGAGAAEAGIKTLGSIAPGSGPVAPLQLMGPAAMPSIPEVASLLGATGGTSGLMSVPGADWTSIPTGNVASMSALDASGTLSPGLQSLGANGLASIGTTAVTKGLLDGLPLAQLGGAALGALASQDQEQTKTQTNEPWKPAQDWIKSNIAAGQGLQQKYTQQPFSQNQQAAYGNLYGLLNSYNKEILPGLLSNANAMSQGYDRFAPEKTRARPSFSPVGSTWNPGLLKFGG